MPTRGPDSAKDYEDCLDQLCEIVIKYQEITPLSCVGTSMDIQPTMLQVMIVFLPPFVETIGWNYPTVTIKVTHMSIKVAWARQRLTIYLSHLNI